MKTLLLITLVFAGPISYAAAWGDLEHMMVAAIAYDRLTPEVRDKVTALLRFNPHYAAWVADVPEHEQARIAFLRASRWPDDIKSDSIYTQDGEQGGNRPSGVN